MESVAHFLYLTNVILCAVLAGYLLSYVITLGAYFTHMLRSGGLEKLQQSYAPFRAGSNVKLLYGTCYLVQLVVSVVSLLLSLSRPLPAQVYAVAVLPIFLTVHVATGFGTVEEKMVSGGALTQQEIDRYTKLNRPLHLFYAALYVISAAWLITALAR